MLAPVKGRFGLSDRAVRLGLKPLAFAVCSGPAALLAWAALMHQLNVNPYNAIVRSTGLWSLRFLCLTVAVTPFRWLTGWHTVVRFRRMFGLFGFFYATLHVLAYVFFDRLAALGAPERAAPLLAAGQVLRAIAAEVLQRPFFTIGFVAFALMVPLAATSTAGMMRRLGGHRWRDLHRLVYAAAIASVLHTYWPLTLRLPRYGAILGVVFALRLGRAYAQRLPRRRRGALPAVPSAPSEIRR
jgi:sulfoxide reductase heme-binding subunit YedZ